MIWADRVAIVWGGVVFAALLFLSDSSDKFDHAMLATTFGIQAVLKLILPVWLLLRGIDWVLGGPRHRRGY